MALVLLAGLVAGALDLAYASTFWGLKFGTTPLQIMQSIAAGWVGGERAFAGGYATASLGLLSHETITVVMAIVFYAAARRWRGLVRRPVVSGMGYGIVLYGVMSYVVVPLSNAGDHALPAWKWENLSHLAAHMLLIGVPCALAARTALSRRTS